MATCATVGRVDIQSAFRPFYLQRQYCFQPWDLRIFSESNVISANEPSSTVALKTHIDIAYSLEGRK